MSTSDNEKAFTMYPPLSLSERFLVDRFQGLSFSAEDVISAMQTLDMSGDEIQYTLRHADDDEFFVIVSLAQTFPKDPDGSEI